MFITMQIKYNIPNEYFRVSVEFFAAKFQGICRYLEIVRVSTDALTRSGYLQIRYRYVTIQIQKRLQ